MKRVGDERGMPQESRCIKKVQGDDLKWKPSTLFLSKEIILSGTSTFKIGVLNDAFDKGVITEKASRMFPVPERDLPRIPRDEEE